MKHIHKDFRKGKRILVILRSGEQIVDKFISNDSLGITLDVYGHIKNKDIRAITIWKGGDNTRVSPTNVIS